MTQAPAQETSNLRRLLASLVEGHRLTADALERAEKRLERMEDFLARIPGDLCHTFNQEFEHEGDARLTWGLLGLSRDPQKPIPPFPQDVKDARATRRLARKHDEQATAHREAIET